MLVLSETIRAAFAHDAEGGRGGLARSPMAETAKAVDPCVARTRCISICNDRSPDEAGKYAVADERQKLGRKMGSNDTGHGAAWFEGPAYRMRRESSAAASTALDIPVSELRRPAPP